MRILYVIDSLAPGGAETSLVEMATGLVQGGVELHVLSLGNRLDLAPELQATGATLHHWAHSSGRLGNVHRAIQVARFIEPDLIHTTLFEADVAGRLAAGILGIPASTSLVNDSYGPAHYAESSRVKLHGARAADTATAKFAAHFHSISSAIAESVPPRIGVAQSNVQVIPRGRDRRKFPFRPSELRRQTRLEMGLDSDTPVILAVGRQEPQKGIHHLLSAVDQVARRQPDLVTLIAGREGRASESLHELSKGSRATVRFLGHRSDISALLAAADVLCFPSEREGFGGVLIEAMAAGCPIVASPIPTTIEVLGKGRESVGNLSSLQTGELSQTLLSVLSNPQEARSRAVAGRDRFETHYTIEAVVGSMIKYFQSCVT
jgi:glycosyltransferase involved in cell wall biosynthesis